MCWFFSLDATTNSILLKIFNVSSENKCDIHAKIFSVCYFGLLPIYACHHFNNVHLFSGRKHSLQDFLSRRRYQSKHFLPKSYV